MICTIGEHVVKIITFDIVACRMRAFVKLGFFGGESPNNFIQEFQKTLMKYLKSYQTLIYDDCRDTYNYAQQRSQSKRLCGIQRLFRKSNFQRCKRNHLLAQYMLSIKGLSILFLFNLRINKKKKAIQCKKGRQRRLFMYWVSLKRKERQRNCVMRWNLHKNTAETFIDRSNNIKWAII